MLSGGSGRLCRNLCGRILQRAGATCRQKKIRQRNSSTRRMLPACESPIACGTARRRQQIFDYLPRKNLSEERWELSIGNQPRLFRVHGGRMGRSEEPTSDI